MTIAPDQRVPNTALRQARARLHMSQSEFAEALRRAGDAAGEPNNANKRLVQKWESGEHASCRTKYRRALRTVTGLSPQLLGLAEFDDEDTPHQPSTDSPATAETPDNPAHRVQHQLEQLQAHNGDSLTSIGGQLTAGSQAAALGGWLALDRGDAAEAQRYFDAALTAARALCATAPKRSSTPPFRRPARTI